MAFRVCDRSSTSFFAGWANKLSTFCWAGWVGWAVGCGLWAVGCGLWAVGCGLWAVGWAGLVAGGVACAGHRGGLTCLTLERKLFC